MFPRRLLPIALLAGLLPGMGCAQSAGASDPQLVLTRRVEPRIAYQALPRRENPISAQAPVFTTRAFDAAMGSVADGVGLTSVDDDILGALGAGGLDGRIAPGLAQPLSAALGTQGEGTGRGTAPLGMSGALGGVGRVTGGMGDLINRALSQALGTGGHP